MQELDRARVAGSKCAETTKSTPAHASGRAVAFLSPPLY